MVKIYRPVAALGLLVGAACATSATGNGSSPFGSSTNAGATAAGANGSQGFDLGDAGFGSTPVVVPLGGTCQTAVACTSGCTDFPADPIIDAATPSDAASHFIATGLGSGDVCIIEPGDGTLVPNNWVRPRFRWTSASQTLFEIRIQTAGQANDFVVYTTNTTYTMPATIWKSLQKDAWGQDITVTIRGVNGSSAPSGSQMKFQIAPAFANGSMIYWAAVGDENGDSWLEGFSAGDETVAQVLNTSQVQEKYARDTGGNLSTQNRDTNMPLPNGPGSVQCIGCHAAVPDKSSVTFADFYPWPGAAANVSSGATGQIPDWLTAGGAEALALPWIGMMTFSAAVWDAGQHIVVAGWQVGPNDVPWQGGGSSAPSNLVWIDLSTSQPLTFAGDSGVLWPSLMGRNADFVTNNKGKSYDYIARNGDTRGASCPAWSHDGTTIAYVSNNNAAMDGRLATGDADIFTVPFNNKAGGDAKAVMGAAEPAYAEYYPWFSPDDKYIAFDRVPAGGVMYYNPNAEVFVVPTQGGVAKRLVANDPPACTGAASPGVTNSWPKWAPQATACGGKTYYWLIFSSSRMNLKFNPKNMKNGNSEITSQLYLTALVDDGSGNLTSYPGVYIWNQPTSSVAFAGSNQSNHTPLWDVVTIPPSPPPK